MKNTFIKISKPCNEKWENMVANKNGNYCEVCTKTVIDLTQLNQQEITEIMKKSGKNICARVTQRQLNTPLLDFETQYDFNLPVTKFATGVMIASTILTTQVSFGENNKANNLIEQTTSNHLRSKTKKTNLNVKNSKSDDYKIVNGKVVTEVGELPIKNARITFVTSQKLFTTYSKEDGTFSIIIPIDLIDDDNVLSISFSEISNNKNEVNSLDIEKRDLILSKEDIETIYTIKTKQRVHRLGGISLLSRYEKTPIVIYNGIEIRYKDFAKAIRKEKSKCNLENKDYLYFESDIAIAIYGKKAKDGLYILTNK